METEEHVAGNQTDIGIWVGGAIVKEVVRRLLQCLRPLGFPDGYGGEGVNNAGVGAAAIKKVPAMSWMRFTLSGGGGHRHLLLLTAGASHIGWARAWLDVAF